MMTERAIELWNGNAGMPPVSSFRRKLESTPEGMRAVEPRLEQGPRAGVAEILYDFCFCRDKAGITPSIVVSGHVA